MIQRPRLRYIPVFKRVNNKRSDLRRIDYAVIDEADYPSISCHTWFLHEGYARSSIEGQHVYMHHLVVPLRDGLEVSHENAVKLDNRRGNLNLSTRSGNMLNFQDRLRSTNTHGIRGIEKERRPLKRPWRGAVTIKGKVHRTRRYATQTEAADALKHMRFTLGLS